MPQLDWSTYPSQLFWLFMSFFLLWGLMAFFVLPPIQKILKKRQTYLADLLEEARIISEKADTLEAKNAAELQAARLICEKKVLRTLQEQKDILKKTKEDLARSSQAQLHGLTEKIDKIKRDGLQEVQTFIPDLRETILHHLRSTHDASEKTKNQ